MAREFGLTLVEMLIVLAIIGVMAGAVTIGLGSRDRSRGAAAEARRLGARLTLAADETMVTDRPIAIDWDPRGYRFVTWDAGAHKWIADKADVLGERHDLAAGLSLASDNSRSPQLLGSDAVDRPIPFGISAPAGERWTILFDGMEAIVSPRGLS